MTPPVMLDLYGGRTGGAARGYQLAGFRVISVDIADCPQNPADVVIQGDALTLLPELVRRYQPDAVHASPPCQGRGYLAKGTMPELAERHPNLIPATREALDDVGLPYILENVGSSGVRPDLRLCGEMFGLGVLMHRDLELGGWTMLQPPHVPHRGHVRGWRHKVWRDGPYVAAYGKGGGKATVAEMQQAKRIDWSDDHLGLRDALPPAYTEFLGGQLLDHLARAAA